jgi:hypothetical protein
MAPMQPGMYNLFLLAEVVVPVPVPGLANQCLSMPGNTQASARRLSDIPSDRQAGDWKPDEEEQNTSKPMLQAAQETVASALGGTSRGGWVR